jgi:hypothetical protein
MSETFQPKSSFKTSVPGRFIKFLYIVVSFYAVLPDFSWCNIPNFQKIGYLKCQMAYSFC